MKHQFKLIFVVGLLAFLISACAVQTAQSSTGDGGIAVGSGSAAQPGAVTNQQASGDINSANIPSLEERDRVLNGMNPSGPAIAGSTSSKSIATPDPKSASGPSVLVPIPVPASSNSDGSQTAVNSAGSQTTVVANSGNIFTAIGDWVSSVLKSIFHS